MTDRDVHRFCPDGHLLFSREGRKTGNHLLEQVLDAYVLRNCISAVPQPYPLINSRMLFTSLIEARSHSFIISKKTIKSRSSSDFTDGEA